MASGPQEDEDEYNKDIDNCNALAELREEALDQVEADQRAEEDMKTWHDTHFPD